MIISEKRLRSLIRQVLLEKRVRVVNEDNVEEKLDFLKDIYRGHFNWQLNNNRHNKNPNILNYSVILSEDLVEIIFNNDKGVVFNPPEEFEDSEFDPDFKMSDDRTPEVKYYINFDKTRWANRWKIDIDRVQTNLRNQDPKWGGFKFSEDLTDLNRVNSGQSAESFLEFVNTIFLWTDRKIKKGQSPRTGNAQNLTRGMKHLRIPGQIFTDES